MENIKQELKILNIQIGGAEKNRDREFLMNVLSDELQFYRADGRLVHKEEFLSQLGRRAYEEINTEIDSITISNSETEAHVVAIVVAKGTADQGAFEGAFKNDSVWKKEIDGVWRMVHWKNEKILFYLKELPAVPDYHAPDGSEIRLLPEFISGGLSHCLLKPGKVSKAVKHKTVKEIWYIVGGFGELWQSRDEKEKTVILKTGVSFTIPVGNSFQFKNTGPSDLVALICTIPKWPGKDEAVSVRGKW